MGKRSAGQFKRNEKDFYPTPYEAVKPLLRHLQPHTEFMEPCAGDGALIGFLEAHGHKCTHAFDNDPRHAKVEKKDALFFLESYPPCETIITNPPWKRHLLHPMIDRFKGLAPTWLLFDADWSYTKQARPLLNYCAMIVAVGRIKWIAESDTTGKDNCAWYLFTDKKTDTIFINTI